MPTISIEAERDSTKEFERPACKFDYHTLDSRSDPSCRVIYCIDVPGQIQLLSCYMMMSNYFCYHR